MGMNCPVPNMAGENNTDETMFWWIVGTTVGSCVLATLYSLFFTGTHSRFTLIVPELRYLWSKNVEMKKAKTRQELHKRTLSYSVGSPDSDSVEVRSAPGLRARRKQW